MAYIVDDVWGAVDNTLGSLAGEHASNTYKPQFYNSDQASFEIGNQYGGALGQALAGAKGRETPTVTGAAIDQSQQAQFRQGQTALGQQLAARASGTAPSAAELQMKQGLDAQIAAQRSAAASARGLSPGAAQRTAAQGMAQAQGQVARDTGVMRAQEQAQAEQALGQHLAAARGQDLGLATQQAGLTQGAALANQQAELQNRAQMDQATQAYIQMGMSREEAQQQALEDRENLEANNQLGVQQIKAGIATGNAATANQAQGGVISAIGTVAGSYAKSGSDKRAKKDVADGAKASAEFLDGLKAYTFRYKPGAFGGRYDGEGMHLGILAQDVEKTKGGKGMVIDTPDGKMLDAGQGIGRLLAAAAELNKRVKKLEGARA